MRRWVVPLAVVLALVVACGPADDPAPSTGPTGSGYTPVPDDELFARVARLPGVTRAEVSHTDVFGDETKYRGDIVVGRRTSEVETLDRAIAILRQGRPGAMMALSVYSPDSDRMYTARDLGLFTPEDLTDRYGEQPGTGEPPTR